MPTVLALSDLLGPMGMSVQIFSKMPTLVIHSTLKNKNKIGFGSVQEICMPLKHFGLSMHNAGKCAQDDHTACTCLCTWLWCGHANVVSRGRALTCLAWTCFACHLPHENVTKEGCSLEQFFAQSQFEEKNNTFSFQLSLHLFDGNLKMSPVMLAL